MQEDDEGENGIEMESVGWLPQFTKFWEVTSSLSSPTVTQNQTFQ